METDNNEVVVSQQKGKKKVITKTVIETFCSNIDMDKMYSLNELKTILGEVYTEVKNQKKKTQGEKKAPNAYNLFIKENMSKIKAENPSLETKDVMKKAAELWKKQKDESK